MTKNDRPLLISIPGAALEMSLPETEVERLIAAGELVAIYLGGQRLVIFESLLGLIRKKRRQAVRV